MTATSARLRAMAYTAWRALRGARRPLALLALGAACGGCFNPFNPAVGTRRAVLVPQPDRETPQGVVRLLEWAYERRDFQVYRTLFTEDYRFFFAPNDTAGNRYLDKPWIRDDEIASAQHLFEGGSVGEPPASSIRLTDNGLNISDTGDTLDQVTHRRITTAISLEIVAGDVNYQVQGNVDFYVVHFRDAKVPADVRSRVTENDWFIYGWVDRTLPPQQGVNGLAAARRAALDIPASWGYVKAAYR